MFGCVFSNAGMIWSCQIVRSSLRQLSIDRLTVAPPAEAAGWDPAACDAAGWDAAGSVEVPGFALVQAPSVNASAAPIAMNLCFNVFSSSSGRSIRPPLWMSNR